MGVMMSEKLPVGPEMLFPVEFSFIFSRPSVTTPAPSSISSSFCRTSLVLGLLPGSMLPSPGLRLPVHKHSAHLLRSTPLAHVGDPGLAVTRGSGEAQLLACCVTLGKCQPLPPDLLASEGGNLDHVISELGAKSHGQLLAVNTLVGRAVGKGRMHAVGRRRPQAGLCGLGGGTGRDSECVCVRVCVCVCVCWGGEARAGGRTQRSCWTRTEEPLSLYI